MKFRRRTYLISSKLQMRFSILFVLVAVLGNVAAVILFNVLALKKIDEVLWSTHIDIASSNELVGPVFININIINVLLVLALLFITGAWILRKTSGPLIRMSKDIHNISEGDLSSPVILRHKDEFKDVAEELNSMIEGLREKVVSIKTAHEGVGRSLAVLKKSEVNQTASHNELVTLQKHINDLKTEVSRFRVT